MGEGGVEKKELLLPHVSVWEGVAGITPERVTTMPAPITISNPAASDDEVYG